MKIFRILLATWLLLAGCRGATATSVAQPAGPKPTVIPLFDGELGTHLRIDPTGAMEPVAMSGEELFGPMQKVTPVPLPTKPPAVGSPPIAQGIGQDDIAAHADYEQITIFDDTLNPNWTLDTSEKMESNPMDTSHWYEVLSATEEIDSGAVAIAATPKADFGTLFFSVQPGATSIYLRENILGLSIWLNSGLQMMDTGDLAIAVVGSNEVPYWRPNDFSVFGDSKETFSETRLYYLNVNRAIPANTWVNVVVWLDDLLYDPPYEYVTGFYIKNDVGYQNTYYVDNVSLITLP